MRLRSQIFFGVCLAVLLVTQVCCDSEKSHTDDFDEQLAETAKSLVDSEIGTAEDPFADFDDAERLTKKWQEVDE
ncbi:hypothetical protein BOX15_Mlig004062g2 [Macrostomum lignano]|uniref:Uncharacterized protein n=1 Tax=Macrostomum lignano TaxID=282301 RepID=A0A267EVW6_9PLAT|nr:hypothetical protein BOX15_Mlig004062g2 [Macrostomum lignano]